MGIAKRAKLSNGKRIRTCAQGGQGGLEGLESRVLLTTLPTTVLSSVTAFPGDTNGGGRFPNSLIVDSAGDFFGTTEAGGTNNYGTIFEVPAGTTSVVTLASFTGGAEGYNPAGHLVLDGTTLYGATTNGGDHNAGSLYSFNTTTHAITILYSLTGGLNGSHPTNGIASDGAGNFYGTTYGSETEYATIFEYSLSSGAFQTLVTLAQNIHIDTGVALDAGTGLVALTGGAIVPGQSSPPVLYASTTQGGADNDGSIISFTPGVGATTAHTIASFDLTHGSGPLGTLYYVTNIDAAGDSGLIGVTSGGGGDSDGAIFDLPLKNGGTTGTIGLLGSFNGNDGGRPNGTLVLVDASNLPTDSLLGNTLYGTTAQGGNNSLGAVFKLPDVTNPESQQFIPPFTNLPFNDNVGIHPSAGFVLLPNGTIFGTLASQGANMAGALFELSSTFPPVSATHLAFSTLPAKTVAGAVLGATKGVVVKLENSAGHLLTTDDSNVTLQVATGPGSFTPVTVAAVNGVATFTNLRLTKAGTYSLQATNGTAHKQSASFAVTAAAAAALAIVSQPTTATTTTKAGPVVVDVDDAFGNLVKTDHSKMVLVTSSGGPGLKGTTTLNAKDGVATFSGLTLTVPGTFLLFAGDGALTGATTAPIVVGLPATHMVFSSVPATLGVAQTFTVQLTLLDATGNVATTTTGTVKIALGTHPSGAKLFGPMTAQVIDGVATFTLSVFKAGAYTLRATDGKFAAISTLLEGVAAASPG